MELLIFGAIVGVIPALIARSKGRGFWGWWIYGSLLFIIAFVHVLLISPDHGKVESAYLEKG